MLPLTMADIGGEYVIRKVSGSPETKQHLYDLGFVVGGNLTVVSARDGNLIVNVKNVRIAIGKEMAQKIMI